MFLIDFFTASAEQISQAYKGIIDWVATIPLSNEILWVLMAILNFATILLVYRLFGKKGLFAWIPMSVILANILVQKGVLLLGFYATLGNIVYATSFLVTDILSENYGRKEANKAVILGFITLIFATLLIQLSLITPPSELDVAQESLTGVFAFFPRIVIGSLAAYLVSQMHDVWAYDFWRKGKLWQALTGASSDTKGPIALANNASTIISQLIDSAVFCVIAFMNSEIAPTWEIWWSIFWTTYIIKAVVAGLDTPLVYWAKNWKDKGLVPED
jgi:uncharacterized integral membrane protein (TIGR00697 family)